MASLFSSLNSVDIPWHKLVPAGVRLWWSQQSSRDQLAVKVLTLFLVLAGGFKLVWLPVHEQIALQEAKENRQQQRLEKAQLRNYERINQFGAIAAESFPDWIKSQLKTYRISVVSHQHQDGKKSTLIFRYADQRKASDFMQQIARRAKILNHQVQQANRQIQMTYQASL